jgi:hypothetical protein
LKGNVLGDIRAEQDTKMLDEAFWESSDYKSLLESYDRPIIVGRRGTGKSALAYRLSKHWANKPKTAIIKISLKVKITPVLLTIYFLIIHTLRMKISANILGK